MAGKGDNTQWVDMPLLLDWELDFRSPDQITTYALSSSEASEDFSFNLATIRQRLVNLFPQKSGNNVYLKQRNRLITPGTFFDKGATVANPRGIFWANSISRLIEIWDTVLYVWSTTDTYTTVTAMGAATDGPGGFAEGINTAGTSYVFAATVTDGVVITTSGNTAVSDADYPASTIPMPVYLDGYVFIAQQSDRSIFNCAVGDATTWTATGFIDTEEYGGNIVGLSRVGRYLVALCENSIEFFKDAGIPAPNSPLQRVSELTSRIGCVNRATIVRHLDQIYFVGKDSAHNIAVFRINHDGQVEKISSVSVDYLMMQHADDNGIRGVITAWSDDENAAIRPAVAYMIPFHGKWYYALICNFGTSVAVASTQNAFVSLAYDPEFKIWIEMAASHFGVTGSSYVVGGWPFPFGTLMMSATLTSDRAFLMQCAYGGAADKDIAALGDGAGFEIAARAGGPDTGTLRTQNIIQWPLIDFNHAGRKDLTGVYIAFNGSTASSGLFSAAATIQPSLVHDGRYANNSAQNFTSLSLDAQAFAPANRELVHIVRTSISSFYQRWFQLFFNLVADTGINAIKFRIVSHEEQ